MIRRRFLKISALSALSLSAVAFVGGWVAGGYSVPAPVARALRVFSPKEYLILCAVCQRILDGVGVALSGTPSGTLPGTQGVWPALWIDRYAANMHPSMQQELRGLLHLVEHSPPALGCAGGAGRAARFTRLGPAAQDAVLAAWAGSERALLRQGMVGLKSLACLAFYQDPRSFAGISYSGPLV